MPRRGARLQLVYHQAKEAVSAAPARCETFVRRTIRIAPTYPEKLSNKIVSAAPFLFALLLHPGMEPASSRTEREVRPIVMLRKVGGQAGSVDGMRRFGVLFACLLTWSKRKLCIYRELGRILLPAA